MTWPPRTTVAPTFEERWDAWRAHGTRHDLAVRRRMRIAAWIIVGVGAVAIAVWFWRGAL
jgi:hypothetical protein